MANEQFLIEVLVKQEVAKELKKIEDEVKRLDSEFTKLQKGQRTFQATSAAADKFSGSVRTAAKGLEALANAENEVRAAQIKYNQAIKAATTETEKQGKVLDTNNVQLREAGLQLKQARENLRQLTAEYRKAQQGSQGFIARIINQHKAFTELSRRIDVAIQRVVAYRIAIGTFQQISRAIDDTVDEVINMDNALADLQKVLRTNESEIDVLRQTAFRLGKEFGRSADEITEGFKTFAQQGLDTNGIIDRTRTLLLAVSATTLDTRGAIEAITAAYQIYGESVGDLNNIVDKWLAIERQVPVQASDFANALKGLAFAANELGLTMDELNGIVAAVGATTRKSGTAIATSFRTILSRATSDEAIKAFQDLDIAVLQADRRIRPFGDIIRDLGGRWDTLTQAQRLNIATVLGARRRYTDFLALMNNFQGFVDATTISQNALGDAQIATAVETEKLSRRLESVNTAFSELKEAVGTELVREFVALVESLTSIISNLKANSAQIADAIRLGIKWLGIISAISVSLRILSSLYRVTGKNVFQLAGLFLSGSDAAREFSRATLLSATSLATLRAIALPLIGIILAIVEAYILYDSAADDTARKQEELNDIIDENARAADEAARKQAILNDTLNEFERLKAIGKENASIAKTKEQLEETQIEFDKLVARQIVFQNQLDNVSKNQEGFTDSNNLLRLSLENNNRALQDAENRIKLYEAQIKASEARILKARGFTVPFEDLNAVQIAKTEIRIAKLAEALRDVQQGSVFKGISIREPDFEFEISDRFITDSGVAEAIRTKIRREIEQLQSELKSLNQGQNLDNFNKAVTETGKSIGLLTGTQRKVTRLLDELSRLDSTIKLNTSTVRLFGEKAVEAEIRLDTLRKAFSELDSQILELQGKKKVIEETVGRDPGLKFNAKLELEVEDSEVQLSQDRILDLQKEYQEIVKEINTAEGARAQILEQHRQKIKEAVDEVVRLKRLDEELETSIVRQNVVYDSQIRTLQAISSALVGTSRSRLLDRDVLARQLAIEEQIIKLEQEREDEADQLRINAVRQTESIEGQLEVEKLLEGIEQRRIKTNQRIRDLQVDTLENLVRELAAVESQISAGIAGALAQIPSNITERAKAEEGLANRRLEAEENLARARKENDVAAVNQALNDLARINQEAQQVGSIFEDIFLGIAESISEARFQKLTQRLADNLLAIEFAAGKTTGQVLADEISGGIRVSIDELILKMDGAFLAGAAAVQAGIIAGFTAVGFGLGTPLITPGGDTTPDYIKNDVIPKQHGEGARLLKESLNIAFSLGAQLLGQVIFGSGRGAAAGSGLGASFGSAAFQQFFGAQLGAFAGPLGILVGSIIGGGIGSLFDDNNNRLNELRTSVDANTAAIENNNELLRLEREFINTPARFTPEAFQTQGAFPGGINGGITVNVNVGGSNASATEIGNAVADSLSKTLADSANRSRSTQTRFA